MASQLSRTLIKSPFFLKQLSLSKTFFSTKPRLIEIDLDSSETLDSSSSSSSPMEVMGFKMLEDALHCIMARRLAPDWLPFRPGSSYWVPPKRRGSDTIVELVEKITNPLSHEQSLSLSSSRGWPSSDFFCQGSIPEPVIPVEVEVQVFLPSTSEKPYMSEDED